MYIILLYNNMRNTKIIIIGIQMSHLQATTTMKSLVSV
jgi:hypothetical protein